MREMQIDIWTAPSHVWRCVTTNKCVKSNGEAVMGRGIAKQVRDRYPGFAKKLGHILTLYDGNVILFPEIQWIAFPTKRDWRENSNLDLIEASARELSAYINANQIPEVWLPRPGCSNGGLYWHDVKSVIGTEQKTPPLVGGDECDLGKIFQ